jgi:hypothetical protein
MNVHDAINNNLLNFNDDNWFAISSHSLFFQLIFVTFIDFPLKIEHGVATEKQAFYIRDIICQEKKRKQSQDSIETQHYLSIYIAFMSCEVS